MAALIALVAIFFIAYGALGALVLLAMASFYAATWVLVGVTVFLGWLAWKVRDDPGFALWFIVLGVIMWLIALYGRHPETFERIGNLLLRTISR